MQVKSFEGLEVWRIARDRELNRHLLIAQELGYLKQSQTVSNVFTLIDNLSVKLNNLIATTRKLKNKESQ
jgi:hypothetical protein